MFDDFLPASSLSGFIAGTFFSGRHKDCVTGEKMMIMLIMMLIDAYDDFCDNYNAGGLIAGPLLSGGDKDCVPLIKMMIFDHDSHNDAYGDQ